MDYDVSSLKVLIPFGNGIVHSIGFLFWGTPFPLCFSECVG